MHILISVFFNAPKGGLHENVLQTINFLKSKGEKVTVLCKPGEFSEKLKEIHVDCIESSFSHASFLPIINIVSSINKKMPISLIHCHPFASKEVALLISQVLGIPIVHTVHGRYLDNIPTQSHLFEKIITVSDGIRTYLIENGFKEPEKLYTSPNTPDSFFLSKHKGEEYNVIKRANITIALATRIDTDKQFVLDVFSKAVSYAATSFNSEICWLIIGDGRLKLAFEEKLKSICGENEIHFTGWLEGRNLKNAYTMADIVVAPGRCALESMACGVPTIGLGSKGYTGLIGPKNWNLGVYSNFGGLGAMHETYQNGAIEEDIKALVSSMELRKLHGVFGKSLVEMFFNADKVNSELYSLYKVVIEANRLEKKKTVERDKFLELQIEALSAQQLDDNQLLLKTYCFNSADIECAWYVLLNDDVVHKQSYTQSEEFKYKFADEGEYSFKCFIVSKAGTKISFLHSKCTFSEGKVSNLSVEKADARFKPSGCLYEKEGSSADLTFNVKSKLDFSL